MPPLISRSRLEDLLVDPHEDLDLEIKNWLDLQNDASAKATFAKAALAIANHGGGFIALGLAEVNGIFVEAPNRPATLDAYTQDLLNGIVRHYADPEFHCQVHHVTGSAGAVFPIIVVPGGHRVPIRARRGGPNGNIIEANAIYMRKPGPRSEVPQTAQEWDTLLARCFSNRRDELLNQMRDLLSGTVQQKPAPPEPPRIDQWVESGVARWNSLVAPLPTDAGPRCSHGYYHFAYDIEGDLRTLSPTAFSELLQESVVRHTGWPPFWYPTRRGIEPYPIDGLVECWLGRDTEQTPPEVRDPAHSDFWRISPEGLAFLLRGYQEDGPDANRSGRGGISSGTVFDVTLPVWRAGETLLHAASLARRLAIGPATLTFTAHYHGLAGRQLISISGNRILSENRVARQSSIDLSTRVELASIDANLPEIVRPLLAPLYSLFDFFELPMSLVTQELAKMRGGQF